jgi:hypothetical protein
MQEIQMILIKHLYMSHIEKPPILRHNPIVKQTVKIYLNPSQHSPQQETDQYAMPIQIL